MNISHSTFYYKKADIKEYNNILMKVIDETFLQYPFFGVRQMCRYINKQGYKTGIKRIRRLMRIMNLMPIYQSKRTTIPNKEHKHYPYLLRDISINKSNQVWCSDITYIPMRKGYLYLVVIMDWYSRKVLSWRLSNIMDTDFCVESLKEALKKYGIPEIFNTDQGCQFTSKIFTGILRENKIKISMDGKGRYKDNIFIERLWRSLKYENVYINAYENGFEARSGIRAWIKFYNQIRPHSGIAGSTPDHCYQCGFQAA